MNNTRDFFAAENIEIQNGNLKGTITTNNSNISFSDEFTKSTYNPNNQNTKIGDVGLKDLANSINNIKIDDNGRIILEDTTTKIDVNYLISDIELAKTLDKVNTFGSIYDFKVKQLSFGDYKYANVTLCNDISQIFGYFSIDKLLNDERSRQLYQNEQYELYKGTSQESLFPPYSGFLIDQNYQVNGWISIDHLIHRALSNNFGYDEEFSFALRTKPFQEAKRIIIMMVLNYVNDMFSLGSYNKLSDFGVRVVDRNTDQEIDLSHIQTNMIGKIGSNILSTYVGELSTKINIPFDETTPTIKSKNINQCDKKYINKCDGVIFTLKNDPEKVDLGCPVCYRHEIGVEVKVNPHADTRINKPDIQNTIDAIHWTKGLINETCSISGERIKQEKNSNYDKFKFLTEEFGDKSYIVGKLNKSRAFASSIGTFDKGMVVGGFNKDNNISSQVNDIEEWNGNSWCIKQNSQMPVGRSLGLLGGDNKQAVYAFGISSNFVNESPTSSNLHFEEDTVLWTGDTWFTPSPYTLSSPNIPRHSVCGKLDIKITPTDNNKNPSERELFPTHTLFNDTFRMRDFDFYKIVNKQDNQDTNWYGLTRFNGFVFGGTNNTSFDLFNIDSSYVTDVYEYVSWGDIAKYTFDVTGASLSATTQAGVWLIDQTKNYPIKAYGMVYVGDTNNGLSTGGKTGKSPSELLNVYTNPSQFNEFESSILNISYEFNGTTWIRRDNMPEEVYYHCGVGDINHSIYWGGLHGSIEQPHIYDSVETYEDWETLISRFGGSTHKNGAFDLDGELRYTLFPTIMDDDKNTWTQVGDINDYIDTNKPLLGTTEVSGLYSLFNPTTVNENISNPHDISIFKVISDTELNCTIYFDGQSWKSKVIRAGSNKESANGERHDVISKVTNTYETGSINEYSGNYIRTNDGKASTSFVPDTVFAERYNITNSLNSDYSGHTVKGGMWLWSRPSKGEILFHPDNYLLKGNYDPTNVNVINKYISHSFNPNVYGSTSGNDLLSLFVEFNGEELKGLDQFLYKSASINDELVFVENWKITENNNIVFNKIKDQFNIKINNEIKELSQFDIKNSSSVMRFDESFNNLLENDPITLVSELHKFIDMQFRTDETDLQENVFIYNLNEIVNWKNNIDKDFYPITYDNFKQFFTENDSNKVTVSNFIKSSSIRDKASLFPWNDLLNGDSSNKAIKGKVTWNWIKEQSNENGVLKYNTYIIVAETIFADYMPSGVYTNGYGEEKVAQTQFWREIFRISKFDKQGNKIWSTNITYDECDSLTSNKEKYFVSNSNGQVGTLFGTGLRTRELNDGISTNEYFDENNNKILRNISLWNSKTIFSNDDNDDVIGHSQYDMTFIDWKKISNIIVPTDMSQYKRTDLISLLNETYKFPSNAISISSISPTSSNWFLTIPGNDFSGMIIADSKLAINPVKRYDEINNSYIVYDDSNKPITGASLGMVKEFISSFKWNDEKWKVVKAYSAAEYSNGYISRNYGKSTFPLPPTTTYPISAIIDENIIENIAKTVYPWNYLLDTPNMCVELVDDTGYWLAYGDSTNKVIDEDSTHTNVYRILHIPNDKLINLNKLSLGRTIFDNINNIRTFGSSTNFRHREALLELVNTQHGELLFDVFVTLTEQNSNKQFGADIPYFYLPVQPELPISDTQFSDVIITNEESNDPKLYCCQIEPPISCLSCGTSGNICELSIVTDYIQENNEGCLSCYIGNTSTENLPAWEKYSKEEWSVPFIESPFAGPFSNKDFNVWISSGNGSSIRWGNLIYNQVPQDGQLSVSIKAHRIGTDIENNKVYLALLTSSIGIDNLNSIEQNNINIPCKVTYEEFIFPTEFGSNTISPSGYATIPFINKIKNDSIKFNKDNGIFCVNPIIAYIPETSGCGNSSLYYYTEWATNFIQEFKNKTTNANDTKESKYYFTHDVVYQHGSSVLKELPEPNSSTIKETDWRRYQDGVGIGGDIPNIKDNCLPLNKWFIGQTAFGTPSKAIIVGGYQINSGDDVFKNSAEPTWWSYMTTKDTFKWNTNVINPEDTYNRNYSKRGFSPTYNNGENTYASSSLGYVMFNLGKNVKIEKRGSINFNGDSNQVEVKFDEPMSEKLQNRNIYSITMSPSDNIKIWWENKTENGFTVKCEINNWIGTVDWSILYYEDLKQETVESILDEQTTYDTIQGTL